MGLQAGRARCVQGDLYFYRVDGDLRGRVEKIDTKVCPLFCSPASMFLLHAGRYKTDRCRYRGAVSIMEQLGHFPMSENPEQFRRYISPVLDQIPAGASE
jgi:ribosomal protein S27AE